MLFLTETETRTTTAPYRETGVKYVNTRLEKLAKQRMTNKSPTKITKKKNQLVSYLSGSISSVVFRYLLQFFIIFWKKFTHS